ncbi:MAG TPA: hypothetical protein VNO52_16725, partial [Methylomirabilota bacterium]|nr:hypothetical protein [Methylomirabilota bacterium]
GSGDTGPMADGGCETLRTRPTRWLPVATLVVLGHRAGLAPQLIQRDRPAYDGALSHARAAGLDHRSHPVELTLQVIARDRLKDN